MFLKQPEHYPVFAPVCRQAGGSVLVVDPDAFLNLLADGSFGGVEGVLCLGGPEECLGGFEQVPERLHHWCHREGVRDLVHKAKPGAHVCDALWGGELGDGVCELVTRLYVGKGDIEPTSSWAKRNLRGFSVMPLRAQRSNHSVA